MERVIEKHFRGRTLVLATMHGKEKILQPLLEQTLGTHVILPTALNTDDFGTFSGEVERVGSPLETARRKCEAAGRLTGESLVLASEGSFGAHPVLGFVPANEELLLLTDLRTGWEAKAKALSTETNFGNQDCTTWDEVLFFASKAGFPSAGLILRLGDDRAGEIHKGIRDWEQLKTSFQSLRRRGAVRVETDMRAFHNPMRMKVIGEAAEKLLAVITNPCPVCEGPGFAVKEVVRGLPCSQCEAPTQTPRAHVYACQHCGHTQVEEYPERKKQEDPMFCDECNP